MENKNNKTNIIIKGLTDKQAKEFILWFSKQGEQDLYYWKNENPDKEISEFNFSTDDSKTFKKGKPFKNNNNEYELHIK